MKTKVLLLSAMLSAVFASCSVEIFDQQADEDTMKTDTSVSDTDMYVPGEAYIYFSEDMAELIESDITAGNLRTKSSELNQVFESLGITSLSRLFPHAGEFEPRTRKEGLHRWYAVTYDENLPHTKAEDGFMSVPGVDFIEPVRRIKINDFDDLNSKLWGLNNTSLPGFDINVIPVWNNYTVGSPNVIVSVVDEGVDLAHEDLAANCLSSGHYNSVDDNNVIVAGSHGTHVAGTIAGVSNNGKGIAGIAGGDYANGKSGVKIMSCQIFKDNPDGSTQGGNSAAAIKWGADHGAVISQNSWGYNYDIDYDGKFSAEELERAKNAKVTAADKSAIDYFIKYAGCDNNGNQLPDSPMKGGIVIFAAGNDALFNAAPGNYEKVVAVGSVASDGTRSSFSNYGDWVDIAAPGSNIYSTLPNNRYGDMNGTSMACPHVSGVAALLVSYFGGPGFTNEMLKERLLSSANTSIFSPAYQLGGLLDAYGAFVYGKQVDVDPVTDVEASGRGNNIDLSWTVPADSEGDAAYGFLIIYGSDKAAVEKATANNHEGADYLTCTPNKGVGEKVTYTIPQLEFSSTYYLKVFAYSYSRSYAEATAVIETGTTANNAPSITTTYDGDYQVKSSETLNVSVIVTEPDGHAMNISYENGSTADSLMYIPDGSLRIVIVGKDAPEGTYTAKVKAEDEYGLTAVKEFTYTILGNFAPEKIKDIDNVLLTSKGQEFTIDMTEYVSDPDGEQLKYEAVISDPKVLHITSKGNQLLGTALGYGTVDVEVIAKDARGESVRLPFKVQVKDPSKPLSVYPNPVTDFVNVSTLDPADTRIRIVSQTGKTVYDETSVVSGYDPARIDMTSCPPGVYSMTVTFGGKEYKQNVVKL